MRRAGARRVADEGEWAKPPLSSVVASSSRATRQKRALAAALDEFEEFTTAQELYARLTARGTRVGLGTIYNQLRSLVQRGEIDAVRSETGEVVYRRCRSRTDRYLLSCRRCRRRLELHAPELELWARRAGAEHGFGVLGTTLELSGLCDECAGSATGARSEGDSTPARWSDG
jgi:Fur family transcriptional regulator, ferric uptake regulator